MTSLRWICLLSMLVACGDDASAPDTGVDATMDASFDAAPEDAGVDAGAPLAWHAVDEPTEGPLMVWGALVTDIGPTSAILFGGTTATDIGGTTLDGAYRYDWDGDALTATEVGATDGPAPRYCGCATFDPDRNVVIVAGGRDLTGPFLAEAETWELDLGTDAWRQWSGSTPASTLGCMLTRGSDGSIYWFGGVSDAGASNVLYRAEDEGWVEVTVTSEQPPPRYDGVLWDDGEGLLLFAGARSAFGEGFYADVWRFADGAWTELDAGTGVPGRRVPWHRVTGDGFVFHGGFDMNMNPMSGLYRFVVEVGFEEMVLEEPLEARGFTAALPAPSGYGAMLSGYDGDGPVREILWLR